MSFAGRCLALLLVWLAAGCRGPESESALGIPEGTKRQALREAFDTTYSPTLYLTTRFLYTGALPIQTGMDPALIRPERISVAHGIVKDSFGQPLPGVVVIVRDHPEFGQTTTNSQGKYFLVLNNLGTVTLEFTKPGRITAQRTITLRQIDYVMAPELWMSAPDPAIPVDFSVGSLQVVRGKVVTDHRGTRRPTLMITPGTVAKRVAGTSEIDLPAQIDLRLTELSVGDNDPRRLHHSNVPERTPIYALAASVDQATAAGSRDVRFSPPLTMYMENILGYPVGYKPRRHSYSDATAKWTLEAAGRVVKIVSIVDGEALIDTDGDSLAETNATLTNLGISLAERRKLAEIYSAGQVLSRSQLSHFSESVDDEYNGSCCPCCLTGGCSFPMQTKVKGFSDPPCPFCEKGSVIEGQTQFIGESFPIAGSPFSLHVQSNRTRGYSAMYSREITMTGATVPQDLTAVQLMISVAGQIHEFSYTPTPNLKTTFTWDGKDTFGQELADEVSIHTTITYVFSEQHGGVYFPLTRDGKIGVPRRAQARGLGGLSIDVHHSYNPQKRMLYKGDGQRITIPGTQIQTVTGGGTQTGAGPMPPLSAQLIEPTSVDTHKYWGGMYIADKGAHQVFVQMGDELTRFAGTGVAGYSGDGGPANQAQLNQPRGVAVWPEENVVFIADTGNHRIRSVWYNNISTYVGTGVPGFSGDGGPASLAQLNNPQGISVLRGVLYIADTGNNRIRRVDLDGTITTVAGGGTYDPYNADGQPATNAILWAPKSVHFPYFDSRFYFTEGDRVRMVDHAGRIFRVAGGGTDEGDGGSATGAALYNPTGLFYRFQDGSLYIAETGKGRIRRVNAEGTIGTFAGTGTAGLSGDGGLSRHAQLNAPMAITQHDSGTFFVADTGNARVRSLNLVTPQFTWTYGYQIPSEDGSEIYRFDNLGYHLATLDARTGAVKYAFQYVAWNTMGELILSKIVDKDCSVESCNELLRIERDTNQLPTAIVAQFGQQTTLNLNSSNYVQQITNPAGEIYSLTWSNDRLVSWTDPRGNIHGYFYDSLGRLTGDQGPAGFGKSLTRIDYEGGSNVTITSALGHKRTYIYNDTGGGEQRILYDHNDLVLMTNTETDGSKSTSFPDGSKITSYSTHDPQYGPWGGYEKQETLRLPSGLTQTVTRNETILPNYNLPFASIAVTSRTSTTTINGKTFTQLWDGINKTNTVKSPVGRTQTSSVNDRGLPTTTTIPGLTPVSSRESNLADTTRAACARLLVHSSGPDPELHASCLGRW